jgi:hypothetical protein
VTTGGLMLSGGPCPGGFQWNGPGPIPGTVVAALGADGQIALFDRVDDQLELGEQGHEYRRDETMGPAHICYRGKDRGKSGWWLTYAHVGPIDEERVAELLATRS